MRRFSRFLSLSRFNTLLLIAIILVNGYTLLLPLLPGIRFQVEKRTAKAAEITRQAEAPVPPDSSQRNQLIIPDMLLSQEVHEGPTAKTLDKGLWRRPFTSTPDKGGNTVIVAHRFTYTNPEGSLYHLDKVNLGSVIALIWDNKKYTYTVTTKKVVPATAIEVEAPTASPQLTIYTCTPLWLPKDRLVIVAEPTEASTPQTSFLRNQENVL